MALHLSVDGEGADWVTEPKGAIKKANLTFVAKFLWLLVRHCLSPTVADNIVTWDRVVLIAAMIAGFEVDFAWLLQAVMHERDFKVTTTYPFPCMIFALCRTAGVPIWHIDKLKTPQTRPMSWPHVEGPVQSCHHLLMILRTRWPRHTRYTGVH